MPFLGNVTLGDSDDRAESRRLIRAAFHGDMRGSITSNFTQQVVKFFCLLLTFFLADENSINLWNAISLVNAFVVTASGKTESQREYEGNTLGHALGLSALPYASEAALFSLSYVGLLIFSLRATGPGDQFGAPNEAAQIAAIMLTFTRVVLLTVESYMGSKFASYDEAHRSSCIATKVRLLLLADVVESMESVCILYMLRGVLYQNGVVPFVSGVWFVYASVAFVYSLQILRASLQFCLGLCEEREFVSIRLARVSAAQSLLPQTVPSQIVSSSPRVTTGALQASMDALHVKIEALALQLRRNE
jgi:hypothetical protein